MRYGRLGPFIVLAILIMGSSSIFATLAKPSDKEEFLCYSKRAANWLLALGQEDNTGLRWPYHEGKADAFATSFYSGSAGVTLYFLNLYKVTGDALYLETAKKAAAGLMADAIQNKDGYRWLEVDEKDDGQRYRTVYAGLYLGAAGIGAVFLALNQVEPRVEYLQYAVGAAAWILAAAKKPYADYSWGAEPTSSAAVRASACSSCGSTKPPAMTNT